MRRLPFFDNLEVGGEMQPRRDLLTTPRHDRLSTFFHLLGDLNLLIARRISSRGLFFRCNVLLQEIGRV